MVLLQNFVNMFYISELRKKLFITLGILVVYRLGLHIPVIGVDVSMIQGALSQVEGLGRLLTFLDMFSGGALRQCTLFALGIGPYITASIMMQILGLSIPYLEQLLKEGEYGRKVINQYTRYLTFLVSVIQGYGYAIVIEKQGFVLTPGWSFRIMFVLSVTIGSMFVMWLGEQIELYGLGRGSSMIIFGGIVAQFPGYVSQVTYNVREGIIGMPTALFILAIFVALTAAIVFLEKGQRKIPVQYTRRVVGQRVYGGQSSYIPFKINTVGVMPVIFAQAMLNIPMFLIAFLASRFETLRWLSEAISPLGVLYNVMSFLLIIFFSFVYTALQYNPDDLADNIKKSGGFVPGIRPGKQTSNFFNYILMRIGLVGALYLGVLAILPNILLAFIPNMGFQLSGTGLLIAVGVALELSAQIETYLIEHRYEGFLLSGRMKTGSMR